MMAIEKVYSGIVSRLDEQLGKVGSTLTMANALSGRTVANEGWMSVGDVQDFQPATDGTLPTYEETYYQGYTKTPGTYTDISVFTGLVRADDTNSTETVSDTWSGGTIVGASLTGDLMSKIPKQEEDFDIGGNLATNFLPNLTGSTSQTLIIANGEMVPYQLSEGSSLTVTGSITVNGNLSVYEI